MTSLILNSPYVAPSRHWQPGTGGALVEAAGRRPASYEIFDIRNNTRRSEALDKVNEIRARVDAWRAAGYPGATAISRRLLEHWYDATARVHPFYFCQLEAIETLIWWVEGAPEFRQGIFLPGDGGPWERVCSKMATGTGKTLVLEIKGEDSEQNRAKRAALEAWVRAVNAKGGFGIWCWEVAFQPAECQDILTRQGN
jgi:type III restriction enzyme